MCGVLPCLVLQNCHCFRFFCVFSPVHPPHCQLYQHCLQSGCCFMWSFFFKVYLKKCYLLMAVLGLDCCLGFSVVAARWGCSHCGVWASGCSGFSGCRAQTPERESFSSWGAQAPEPRLSRGARLSCSASCGVFLAQGLNPWPLHWQMDSWPLSHQGIPSYDPLVFTSAVTLISSVFSLQLRFCEVVISRWGSGTTLPVFESRPRCWLCPWADPFTSQPCFLTCGMEMW